MEIVAIFITTILVLAILLLYFMYVTTAGQKRTKTNRFDPKVNLSQIPSKWAEIMAMMKVGGPANFKLSIMEGDKLVDSVLIARVGGETTGERLKNAKYLFSKETYNSLWAAHKVRNRVAHDSEFEGLSSEASLAVRGFEKALKELRVI